MLSRYFIKSFMQHDWSFGRHSYSSSRRLVYAPVWVFLCPQVQKGPTLGLLRDYIKQLSSSRILLPPLACCTLAQVWVLAAADHEGFNCLKNACQKISSFKLGSSSAQDPAPFQASWCTFFLRNKIPELWCHFFPWSLIFEFWLSNIMNVTAVQEVTNFVCHTHFKRSKVLVKRPFYDF